jgi:hypothetical protein
MARPKNKIKPKKDIQAVAYDVTEDDEGNYILVTIHYDLETKQAYVKETKYLSDTLETAKYKFDVLTYKKLLREAR